MRLAGRPLELARTLLHELAPAAADFLLSYDPSHFDDETRRLLRATIAWFEHRGKERLLEDYRDCVWYADFLEFVAKERLFAKMGTPAPEANGDRDKRWDTSRISGDSPASADPRSPPAGASRWIGSSAPSPS